MTAVDSGWLHTCAAKSDGTLTAGATTVMASSGLGNTTDRNTPASIPALAGCDAPSVWAPTTPVQ
ncbi:MAG: hypothetical protein IPH38_20735 [Candidatus Microthrix sp.]|nr:hypothetical protein [Candidatus Microthrix sp.]MBK7021931.1 hypothetical protein [Candidatus Microthrix sp.]